MALQTRIICVTLWQIINCNNSRSVGDRLHCITVSSISGTGCGRISYQKSHWTTDNLDISLHIGQSQYVWTDLNHVTIERVDASNISIRVHLVDVRIGRLCHTVLFGRLFSPVSQLSNRLNLSLQQVYFSFVKFIGIKYIEHSNNKV